MQMIWKNCGILLGKIVAFYMQFDIHKNLYFLRICGNFNTSKIAFGSACRALCAVELRYLSTRGRYLHLRCVVCG